MKPPLRSGQVLPFMCLPELGKQLSSLCTSHTDLPDQFMKNNVVDVLFNVHQLQQTLHL